MATQDKGLQRQCMAVSGGAVLFASINGVHLEVPSEMQKQRVKMVGAWLCLGAVFDNTWVQLWWWLGWYSNTC